MSSKHFRRIKNKLIGMSVGLGVGGLFMYKSVADLFPHQICKDGKELKDDVPARCRTQFREVAKKFGFHKTEKVTLFVNKDFHAISAGSTLLPNGAVLGLPRWYLYEYEGDVENSGLKYIGRDIEWNSELGVTVKKCLLPTNDMIAFTIGHELAHIQRLDHKLFDVLTAPLWLYLTIKVASVTPVLFKLRPRIDVALKVSILGLSYVAYNLAYQRLCHTSEFNADEMSAKCDPRMCQGAVEFFSKRIKLNLILRKLQGKEGEDYFTEEGDEILSYAHPRLTQRLRRVKAILDSTKTSDSMS